MNDLVDQLVSVVAEEAEQCERLLTLLRQQQRHLVEGNIRELDVNVREQEVAIGHAHELGRRRQRLLEELARCPAFGSGRLDMSRLIATLADDYGRRLDTLRRSLKQSISQLVKTKEQNAMLITRSLSTIDETMRLLASANMAADYGGATASGQAPMIPLAVDRMC